MLTTPEIKNHQHVQDKSRGPLPGAGPLDLHNDLEETPVIKGVPQGIPSVQLKQTKLYTPHKRFHLKTITSLPSETTIRCKSPSPVPNMHHDVDNEEQLCSGDFDEQVGRSSAGSLNLNPIAMYSTSPTARASMGATGATGEARSRTHPIKFPSRQFDSKRLQIRGGGDPGGTGACDSGRASR